MFYRVEWWIVLAIGVYAIVHVSECRKGIYGTSRKDKLYKALKVSALLILLGLDIGEVTYTEDYLEDVPVKTVYVSRIQYNGKKTIQYSTPSSGGVFIGEIPAYSTMVFDSAKGDMVVSVKKYKSEIMNFFFIDSREVRKVIDGQESRRIKPSYKIYIPQAMVSEATSEH